VSDAKRSYVGNRFCLELQNRAAGWLLSAEGGLASTETVHEWLSNGYPARKHAGNVKVDDITVNCGTAMSQQFYEWLKTSIEYKHERKQGSIITGNYDFKEVVRQDFFEALITEVGLPGVDATSKDACKFSIKFSPEYTEHKFANGGQSILPTPTAADKQKQWQASNFRLSIDGMDCRKTSKVEPLTIKQNIVDNTIGERLIYQKEPSQIEFPPVVFFIPESQAEPWYKWYDDFVCRGNSSPDKEKQGQLEYLSPDCATTLFLVEFNNLGILKFTPDKHDSSSEKIRYVKIELYCEQMKFDYNHTGIAP
jgi:hypothetical protein